MGRRAWTSAAIVTGGSHGIGRETARVLPEAGARVTICARGREALEQARAELQAKAGGEVLAVVADMAVEADVERLASDASARWGGFDILVNNAGTMYSGRFAALTDAGLQTQLDTKVFGFMRAVRPSGRAGRRHRVPVFRAGELHHRRLAERRRWPPQKPLVTQVGRAGRCPPRERGGPAQ
ncbi:MAG TPA: SDR family oxidoreductase [Methylomirabilota bacterium]|nr:SDR family oxidoreductase [Methylomirabilota bacterium]